MVKDIPIHTAKQQLPLINNLLHEPHLLIGGLAVNQYVYTRRSKDIDLVCDDPTAQMIIKTLWNTRDYKAIKKGTEYRPSHTFVKRGSPGGEFSIEFGPKILERDPYPNLDWGLLLKDGHPFKMDDGTELENIKVPSLAGLMYSKLLSFIARDKTNIEKRKNDLEDLMNLSNMSFELADFTHLITHANTPDLYTKFLSLIETKQERDIFALSSLKAFSDVASVATVASNKLKQTVVAEKESFLTKSLQLSSRRLTDMVWMDDRRIAVCGATGDVLVFDVIDNEILLPVSIGNEVLRSITHLKGSDNLICGADGGDISLVDTSKSTVKKLHDAQSDVHAICTTEDGLYAYTASGAGHIEEWQIIDIGAGTILEKSRRLYSFTNGPAFCLGLDLKRRWLFAGGQTGELAQIDLENDRDDIVREYSHPIFSIAKSENLLAVGTVGGELNLLGFRKDGALRQNGDIQMHGHRAHISGLSFDESMKFLISCSKDRSVRLWANDTRENTILYFSDDYLYQVSVSPDQTKFASVDGVGRLTITYLTCAIDEINIGGKL